MSLAARAQALLTRHWWRAPPGPVALALRPLAAIYGALADRRRRASVARTSPVPVLVVGNLVVGGAGKTPTVIAVVQAMQAAGRRPGVVSRGHGRLHGGLHEVTGADTAEVAGDEPLLVRRRTGAPVFVGADRAEAAIGLCAAHPEVDVLVSDDGLQHHRLARRAELVVFDERGAGNGLLLPAGPLREPMPRRLPENRRVLYTAGVASTPLPGVLARRELGRAVPLAHWLAGSEAGAVDLTALRGRVLLAAAGLAAPEKFFAMLEHQGLSLRRLPLPDHHDYATLPWPADTPEVLVTEKDAVKLHPARTGATRVWVVPLDLALPAGLVAELSALLFETP